MYAAPPAIDAEIFAEVPDSFLIRGKPSGWGDVHIREPDLPVFLEGPSFDREGNLWVVDIPWGRLFKITPEGKFSCELEYDGRPNGLKFHKDGRAFIADGKNGLMVFDPRTGAIAPVLQDVLLQPFKGLNDLCFASNGDLYFTDQGHTGLHDPSGRLYRLRVDGTVECLLSNVPSPNGLVLDAKERVLYLAATRGNAVWRVPLVADGLVMRVGIYIQMSGGGGPDGLAIDTEGGLAVSHLGLGSVWLFSPEGEPQLRIRTPRRPLSTNCAFGGPDRKHLYITTPSSVLVAPVPVSGARMFSHS
jgi:gluconolactonase